MRKILIINQYSSNKGDRAVLYALVRLLDSFADTEITVSTSTISDWDTNFKDRNIKFVPWGWEYHLNSQSSYLKLKFFVLRRFLKFTYAAIRNALLRDTNTFYIAQLINPDFLKALKETDLVISTGGHHVTTILAKNAVSSQIFDLACCELYKKKTILWSQSIGPLEFTNTKDKFFVEKILKKINSIYVRDEKSVEIVKNIGCDPENIHLTFETVLFLNKHITNYIPSSKRNHTVGISIYSTVNRSKEEIADYANAMSELADYCVEKAKCKVVFMPMELKGSGPDDRWLINEIMAKIKHKSDCSIIDTDLNTEDHFAFVQSCSYFIGHKTHSVIFALAAGTPLLAIAYHPKTIEFMKQFGVEKYAVADKDMTAEKLISCFEELIQDADHTGEIIFNRSREIAGIIEQDFNSMINKYK